MFYACFDYDNPDVAVFKSEEDRDAWIKEWENSLFGVRVVEDDEARWIISVRIEDYPAVEVDQFGVTWLLNMNNFDGIEI